MLEIVCLLEYEVRSVSRMNENGFRFRKFDEF